MPNTVLVPLTKGMFAVIDAADAEVVGACNWQVRRSGKKGATFYAGRARSPSSDGPVLLHRFLWKTWAYPPEEELDHVNRDGLDCRRTNLRPARHIENANNVLVKRSNTSGYPGVDFVKNAGKWRARIAAMGKKKSLGYFNSPEEAGAAYVAASVELRGRFSAHGDEKRGADSQIQKSFDSRQAT